MILKYPYPYRAWLSIANDPDNTLLKDWRELDQLIWKELALPLANSLFVRSYNRNLPGQVNLVDHPEIAAQPHDTIHTWGDYMHAGARGFERADALDAIQLLRSHRIQPRVWIDHAQFLGNLLHHHSLGATPELKDMSGHKYPVLQYTLDLIEGLGIKYIWDGDVVELLGQDRPLRPYPYFREVSTSEWKAAGKYALHMVARKSAPVRLGEIKVPSNEQYFPHRFPDGRILYCFRRYGTWKEADIYGIHRLIAPENISRLLALHASCIVYTHLGKRPADKVHLDHHVPENTRKAFEGLARRYKERELMISPVSAMLDYFVLRDHVRIKSHRIEFRADGIRFDRVGPADLAGKKFSFTTQGLDPARAAITADGMEVAHHLIRESAHVFSIEFPPIPS